MLALGCALILVAAQPLPPAARQPVVQWSTPLREVAYKVSYTRHEELTQSHYGAMPPDPTVADTGDKGTLRIDVMAVGPNGLGVKVSENWDSHRVPAVYAGSVINDGRLLFGDQPLSEVTEALLPFFAPRFTGEQALDEGSSWVIDWSNATAASKTSYLVQRADGEVLTVAEIRVVQMKGPQGMNISDSGTVRYKPSRLVPISGTLSLRSERMGVDTFDVRSSVINFERISDTRDRSLDP